ncbi:MAG: matrixin family metalloprotease [Deltaproteobacteria bacterium]|nr:matrixin family metalloprotease [Deltaproteobacteria bacterium]
MTAPPLANRFVSCAALVVAVLPALTGGAHAYTLVRTSAASSPLRWPSASQPVLMQLSDRISASLPNMAAGSDPAGAIRRALSRFPAVSAVRFQDGTTSAVSGGRDGVNLVSFADTTPNREIFEMAGGAAVVGLTLYFYSGSELIEADVLFNPALAFTTTLATDEELQDAGQFDVQAVATHEFGHVIGLHHTGVESAAMWPLASVLQRQLDADDVAGANALYPAGAGSGTVAGSVTVAGAPAFGAHVVALSERGAVAASALTLPGGTYAIERLAPGRYTLYAEPLDGPHSSVPADHCVRFGNLSGAGIYNNAVLTVDFATQFHDGVDVVAEQTTTANFSLAAGAPAVNPAQIGPATLNNGSISAFVATRPLAVSAGSEQWLAVAGANVDQVPVEGISLGPDITVDLDSRRVLNATCDSAPFPFLLFRVAIDRGAATGGRTIVLTAVGQPVAFTAALRLNPAPLPCVGDCDDDGAVTVDELVRGVNIALGNTTLEVCPQFDSSDDGSVTVDELVQAVNAALSGCE